MIKSKMQKVLCATILLSAGSTFSMETPKTTNHLSPPISLIRYFVHYMDGKVKKLKGIYETDEKYLFKLCFSKGSTLSESAQTVAKKFNENRREKNVLERYKRALEAYRKEKMEELASSTNIFGPFLLCGLNENLSNLKIPFVIPTRLVLYIFQNFFRKKIDSKKLENIVFNGLPLRFVESMMQPNDHTPSKNIIRSMIENWKKLRTNPICKMIIKPYKPMHLVSASEKCGIEKDERIQKEFLQLIPCKTDRKNFFDSDKWIMNDLDHRIKKHLKKNGLGLLHLFATDYSDIDFSDFLSKNSESAHLVEMYMPCGINTTYNYLKQNKFPTILRLEADTISEPLTINLKITSLKEIYFSHLEFQKNNKFFANFLSNCDNLEVFSAIQCSFDGLRDFEILEDFPEAIKNHTRLRTLILEGINFNKKSAQLLVNALTEHKLTKLMLGAVSENLPTATDIDYEAVSVFFNFLAENKNLLSFSFARSENKNAQEELEQISQIEIAIVKALTNNKTLESFLYHFPYSEHTLENFSLGLKNNTSIKNLTINYKKNETYTMLDHIADEERYKSLNQIFLMLQEQKYIRSLVLLSGCHFLEKESESFLPVLQNNTTLTSLKIDNFHISDSDLAFGQNLNFHKFFQNLTVNKGILRLKMNISVAFSYSSLIECLKKNKTLQSFCFMLPVKKALLPIARALQFNKESCINTLRIKSDLAHRKIPREAKKIKNDFFNAIKEEFSCNITEKKTEYINVQILSRKKNNDKKRKFDLINDEPQQEEINEDMKNEAVVHKISFRQYVAPKETEEQRLIRLGSYEVKLGYLQETMSEWAKQDDPCFNLFVEEFFGVAYKDMTLETLKTKIRSYTHKIEEEREERDVDHLIPYISEDWMVCLEELQDENQETKTEIFDPLCFYENKKKLSKDGLSFKNATSYFDKAAEKGSSQAMFFLARLFFSHQLDLTTKFLSTAAHQNHLASLYLLHLDYLAQRETTLENRRYSVDFLLFCKVKGLLSEDFSSLLPDNFTDYDRLRFPNNQKDETYSQEIFEKIQPIALKYRNEAMNMFGFIN